MNDRPEINSTLQDEYLTIGSNEYDIDDAIREQPHVCVILVYGCIDIKI
jgi:hypothetical protein